MRLKNMIYNKIFFNLYILTKSLFVKVIFIGV